MESHAEFLRWVTLDEELAAALRRDYTTAALSEADRAMLDYAAKLTRQRLRTAPTLDIARAIIKAYVPKYQNTVQFRSAGDR